MLSERKAIFRELSGSYVSAIQIGLVAGSQRVSHAAFFVSGGGSITFSQEGDGAGGSPSN